MLSIIELAAYFTYIYYIIIKRRTDSQAIKIGFVTSSLIAGINIIEVIFLPRTSQYILSIILSFILAAYFGVKAKKYYDLMK